MYISRNPNLCLVARQESSNRDMFSMLKKKLLSLFQYPRVLFFFLNHFIFVLHGLLFFSSPHLVLVCTYLKRRATPLARQADAGAVTTQTLQESHSHHLDMRAMLGVEVGLLFLPVSRTRCRSGSSHRSEGMKFKDEPTQLLRLREPKITQRRVCVCV